MEQAIRNWWLFLVLGIAFLVISAFMLFKPIPSFIILAQFMVIYFLVTGIFEAFFALSNRNLNGWGWHLAMGIFQLVLGLYLLSKNAIGLPETFLIFLAAFWLIFYGISLSALSFNVRRLGVGTWYLWLILGIIAFISGSLIMFYPFSGILFITLLIGINAGILGIFNIFSGIRLRKLRV